MPGEDYFKFGGARRRMAVVAFVAFICSGLVQAQSSPEERRSAPQPTAPLPKLVSPMDQFRELLAMTPARRLEALTNRPAGLREPLMVKLREYDALSPNEREIRLRTTELRYYLLPMLGAAKQERATRLQSAPANMQSLVRDRLAAWDALPADLQRDVLQNEAVIRYFREGEKQGGGATNEMAQLARARLEEGIAKWRAIAVGQQQRVLERFDQLFMMSRAEREVSLKTLSDAERRQIEEALRGFEGLAPAQRARCAQSLNKFISLTAEERAQFLRSAEKWKAMPPDQRSAWRNMVSKMMSLPPMPPGTTAWPLPPVPPTVKQPWHAAKD